MATEPIKINTGKYNKQGKVDVDGKIWSVKLPGAGSELRLSQAQRTSKLYATRIELIEEKIENKTATEEDLDKYEEYSEKFQENDKLIYESFGSIFNDGTKDNSEVKKWLNETPMIVILMSFEDIKKQANPEPKVEAETKEAEDGRSEPSKSS